MRHAWNGVSLLLVLVLWSTASSAALRITCHIHPPPREPNGSAPATTLGPFATEASCETARRQLLGEAGRCHCAPGFGSPLSPGAARARAPLSGGGPNDQPLP
jgi:hypothetical protein